MIKYSILITTRNRVKDLALTLDSLKNIFAQGSVEVIIFSDGCEETTKYIKQKYPYVRLYHNEKSIGASPARNFLYAKASGQYLIGLDDDAHFVSENVLEKIEECFKSNSNLGIIAFKEFRGINVKIQLDKNPKIYYTNDFIGCGFCVLREAYKKTNGFPVWMDIYGEEACLSIELLDLNFSILFTESIAVHHRVDKKNRENQKHGLFRFKKSLLNGNKYFIIYYPLQFLPRKMAKIFFHNFFKYALTNKQFFFAFVEAYCQLIKDLPKLLRYRSPVKVETLHLKKNLKPLKY